jgi:predicted DCC family thiol-disulfide oxidoreductase YuxK
VDSLDGFGSSTRSVPDVDNCAMESRRDHALLYDGDCGFCRLAAKIAMRLDDDHRLRPVAIQSEEGQRLLTEVPEGLRLESFHVVTPGGHVVSGPDAAPLLTRLLRGGHGPSRAMRRFPRQTAATYGFVSRHRGTLGRLGLRAGTVD